ncbi:MAG: hypothetical protein ACK2TV_12740, partial [Anaerolineales bacterium]
MNLWDRAMSLPEDLFAALPQNLCIWPAIPDCFQQPHENNLQAFVPVIVAVALGTILSFIPAPILDTLFVGIIFARFRQVNRSALLLARVVWNDLIVVPLYVPSFRFGMRLLEPYTVNEPSFVIKALGFSLGLTILTAAAAILSMVVTFGLIKIFQKWQMTPSNFG